MLRENKLSIFANLILVMLMSSSICQALYTSLFMTHKLSLAIFIAVIPLTLLFFVMFRSKVSTIVSAIVTCIMLIIGLVFIFYKIGITNVVNWLSTYSTWFIDVTNGFNDTSYLLYTNLTLITLAFIISLFVFIFSIKFYNFYVISIMFFSVFFVQLQFKIFLSKISFVLFMFSFLLYYFFDILKRRSKELTYDIGNRFKYLICIIPVCIVIIANSFLFPIKSTRIAVPWLDTKFDSVINNIIDYFSNNDLSNFDYFSLNATGFGNEDRLGGNLKLSKTHVMNVKSDYTNLYLKASSKAFYNGHNWYEANEQLIPLGKSFTSYSEKIKFDSHEFFSGLNRTGVTKSDSIFKQAKAEIEYTNLKTKSIFIPTKANLLTFKNSINLFFDNEQMFSTNEIQKNGFKYTVEYYNIILNSEDFKTNIRKSYKGYYNDSFTDNVKSKSKNIVPQIVTSKDTIINAIADSWPRSGLFVNTAEKEALKEKAEIINRRYTQLPDTVTMRVRKLAKDITKDKYNNYDKAKAIETYLSDNYPYTLTPGNAPRKKDFVDYFLFDGKKGYCTYYASAMTVLLRCIDIPARYVEGYILPPETDKKGIYNVTNQQAHAWVEVYFEGFGWIPFEPTSPFVSNMYNDETTTAKVSNDMLNSEFTDYMDMIEKYKNKYGNGSSGFEYTDLDTTQDSKNDIPLIVLIVLSSVIGSILLGFAILVLINILKLYSYIRRIRKGDPNSSVLMSYSYILKVLGTQDIVFKPGETPSEFGIRIDKTIDFKSYSLNKTSFTKITNHYIKARYSKAILSKNDKQDMLDLIEILICLTMEKTGRLKFFIARYVLGKI